MQIVKACVKKIRRGGVICVVKNHFTNFDYFCGLIACMISNQIHKNVTENLRENNQ
tara:strand:- start:4728 stop:4895 length:168 start_codon:yes stop_codon:yes gene_type:complete